MAVRILPDEIIYPDTTALWEKELEDQLSGLSALPDKAKTVEITPSAGA